MNKEIKINLNKRTRKPYRKLKPRQTWSKLEHEKFIEAIDL